MKWRNILYSNLILSTIAILGLPQQAYADRQSDFREFLTSIQSEMRAQKIDPEYFRKAIGDDFSIDEKAIKKMQSQPEFKMTFDKYTSSMLSKNRIAKGKLMMKTHKVALDRISKKYGIPAETIVALWGIESFYGKWAGQHRIARSLATLAFDSHRPKFFKKELFAAVRILQEGHIEPENLTGSWAGAMGQCQFMPTSFMAYAADGDNDGHKNIWTNEADVFASAANYLKKHRWQTGQKWGQRVVLSKILPSIDLSERGLTGHKTIAQWQKIGIVAAKGGLPSNLKRKARLYLPKGPSKEAYLLYRNFDTVLDWNRSSYFSFSVHSLADAIAGKKDS